MILKNNLNSDMPIKYQLDQGNYGQKPSIVINVSSVMMQGKQSFLMLFLKWSSKLDQLSSLINRIHYNFLKPIVT